jgi:hypothetical protein
LALFFAFYRNRSLPVKRLIIKYLQISGFEFLPWHASFIKLGEYPSLHAMIRSFLAYRIFLRRDAAQRPAAVSPRPFLLLGFGLTGIGLLILLAPKILAALAAGLFLALGGLSLAAAWRAKKLNAALADWRRT